MLEKEVNVLGREYEYYTIQNMLLDNLELEDLLVSKLNSYDLNRSTKNSTKNLPRASKQYNPSNKILELEEANLKTGNKL